MPKIEQYTPQEAPAGPVEGQRANAEDTGYVGQAIQNIGNAATQANQFIMRRKTQAEVADVAANGSQLLADQTVSLNKQASDPNADPETFVQNALDNFDQNSQSVTNAASTPGSQNLAEKTVARIRKHVEVQAGAIAAKISGAQAGTAFNESTNSLTTAAYNGANLEVTMGTSDDTLQALQEAHPDLSPKQIEQWSNDRNKMIATAHADGLINRDPEEALNQLNSKTYDSYINGEQKAALVKKAQTAVDALDTTDDHDQKMADKAKKDAAESYFKAATMKLDNWTAADTKKAQEALPPTGPNSFHQFMEVLKNSKEQSDPLTVNDTTRRIALPDGDPNQINAVSQIRQLQAQGKLNITDANRMAAQLDKSTDAKLRNTLLSTFTKQATAALLPLGETRLDAKGNQMLAGVLANAHAQLDGKPIGDQSKMLTPSDPTYIGDALKTLHRDPIQDAKDKFDSMKMQQSAPAPAPVERTVKVNDKDTAALFDPTTKKFLRYK